MILPISLKVLFLNVLYYTVLTESACVVKDFSKVLETVEVCDDIILDNIFVPGGETLRLPLKNGAKLTFRGNLTFEHQEHDGYLVVINATNALIEGEEGSILDGQGDLYWDGHGAIGVKKPKFFSMVLHNTVMRNITVVNAPMHCMQLFDSTNVELSYWVINNLAGNNAATLAKNTDGFDVRNTTGLVIRNSVVFNQDDCVALNSGANILVEDLICYGGHGLSLSVGFSDDEFILNSLENVTVANSVLNGGENAIHIKTHQDSGEGIMRNITYRNIQFVDVRKYGIHIQENYGGDSGTPPRNNIPIRNLTLENIIGRVESTAVPISILCAEEGCFDWTFNNIFIVGSKSSDCNYTPVNFSC